MKLAYLWVTMFVALWEPVMPASDHCLKIAVDGDDSKNKLITVEENTHVNVSFHVKPDACRSSSLRWFLKLSRNENGMMVDECKLLFTNMRCTVTDGEQPCSCSQTDRQTILFQNFFSESVYKIYQWAISPHSVGSTEKMMEIVFVIRKPTGVKDIATNCNDTASRNADGTVLCLSLPFIAVPCAAFVIIVVAVAVACPIRRRCKARSRRQSPEPKPTGRRATGHANRVAAKTMEEIKETTRTRVASRPHPNTAN